MAAYAYTATMSLKSPKALLGFPGLKAIMGSVDITNYNSTTPVEVTEISQAFKGPYVVIPVATEFPARNASWDYTAKSFILTVGSTGSELATDQDGGVVHFIALGIG